jgi:hypothetical protein
MSYILTNMRYKRKITTDIEASSVGCFLPYLYFHSGWWSIWINEIYSRKLDKNLCFVCCVCVDCITSRWLTQRNDIAQITVSTFQTNFLFDYMKLYTHLFLFRPRTQHDYHHDTKVKPEVAAAVIELLMMGGKTPEICWAVNKRQDNKLKNRCIRLVIYLN